MKQLFVVLLLIPFSLTAQKALKKAEKETNQCIESYVRKNGVEWNEIQAYFEKYLALNSIYKQGEDIEQGYLNFIKLRKLMKPIPPMPQRDDFKTKLLKVRVIDDSNYFIGKPLNDCFSNSYIKYKDQLPEKSTFVNIELMFETIKKVGEISPALIVGGLDVAFEEGKISHPLYKKVIILSLFIDAIYLDEIQSEQVSPENPYKREEIKSKDEEEILMVDDEIEIVSYNIEEVEEEELIFVIVEKMPEFPGGPVALKEYIAEHIKYPEAAKKNGIEGKVYIRFCITEKGEIDYIDVARGIDPVLDKEAIRVIRELPKWKPGEQRGGKVKVWYTVPVQFSLQKSVNGK